MAEVAGTRRSAPPGALRVETLIALRRARDLIDSRYAEPLDLDAIAAAAGYSRYHFARAFRAAYGETPARYLSRRRVERAQELLRSVNLTVTEVCHLIGFNSLGSFSSRFAELVGVPPSQFQRDARRGSPPPIPGCYSMMCGMPVQGRPGEPRQPGKPLQPAAPPGPGKRRGPEKGPDPDTATSEKRHAQAPG